MWLIKAEKRGADVVEDEQETLETFICYRSSNKEVQRHYKVQWAQEFILIAVV